MATAHQLKSLGPFEFEHLVNALAIRVLGNGATGFGPGADSGRDCWFVGEAAYPNEIDRWCGNWVIQAKFQVGDENSSRWLLKQIERELAEFDRPRREWPDNYIVATNVEPTGKLRTGAYDKAKQLVAKRNPALASRFDIWGGKKILNLLAKYPDVAAQFAHLLTPGHVVAELIESLTDSKQVIQRVVRYLVVDCLSENSRAKLEQAGDTASNDSAGVHQLFTELPFKPFGGGGETKPVLENMTRASANSHRPLEIASAHQWLEWQRLPQRARVWFLKGGPGQGKSTTSQYYAQIQRAALLLTSKTPLGTPQSVELANAIRKHAEECGYWPQRPRIPVHVELKDYAAWHSKQADDSPRRVTSYLASTFHRETGEAVTPSLLLRAFAEQRWAFVFDGLDEVSGDVKEILAREVERFVRETFATSDSFVVCSSRPQGYSGQFDRLDACVIELAPLTAPQALACAKPVLQYKRPPKEAEESFRRLKAAVAAPSVRDLMTTPLQSHIMAVIVRSGQRPPERKWNLYSKFFSVILAREANRNLHDKEVARLLEQDERLLRSVHSLVGIELHTAAEVATGTQAELSRERFIELTAHAVRAAKDDWEASQTIDAVKRASEERLVLISTPTDKSRVRYDIRQLQEFFAAEFLYDGTSAAELEARFRVFAGDSHWREVVHFLLSALVEGNRRAELGLAVQVLSNLDTDDNPNAQVVARRLARGARIIIRLLEDGVLEGDKSLRNLFRSVLSSLAASPSPLDLAPLLALEGNASRLWVADVMASELADSRLEDRVGAATAVWHLLPESHPRFAPLRARIAASDGKVVAAASTATPTPLVVGDWQRHLLAEKLSDDAWIGAMADIISLAANHPRAGLPEEFVRAINETHGPAYGRLFCAISSF